MEQKLAKISDLFKTVKAQKDALVSQLGQLDSEIESLSRSEITHSKAVAFCDQLIEVMNSASVEDIEKLITEALQTIFDKPYKFKMNPQVKRGNMTYSFTLGDNETDIMDAEGGGIVQVISLLMRIVTISISKPKLQKILVLDESLGMLSAEYISNASKSIKDLGSKLGFTIVLVTHQQQFVDEADAAYKIEHGEVVKL